MLKRQYKEDCGYPQSSFSFFMRQSAYSASKRYACAGGFSRISET